MAHALLSPSAAHRWTECPGSVFLTKDLPDHPNAAAAYGTLAHHVAEKILSGVPLADLIATNDEIDEELIEGVKVYVDYVKSLETPTSTLYIEQQLPVGHITSEHNGKGTADAILVDEELHTVIDLKFGYTYIYAEDNKQLKIYALGAIHRFGERDHVKVVIVQPRNNHISEFTYSLEELYLFQQETFFKGRAAYLMATGQMDPSYLPSPSNCKWCKGKAHCPALANKMFKLVESENDLNEAAKWIDLARKWTDSIEERLVQELVDGKEFEDWELGVGRQGNRKWINEQEAAELLTSLIGDKAFQQRLISPTQAAKLTEIDIESLVTREPGKPIYISKN